MKVREDVSCEAAVTHLQTIPFLKADYVTLTIANEIGIEETRFALLSSLLVSTEVKAELYQMCGAELTGRVLRKGRTQLLQLQVTSPNEAYLWFERSLLKKALHLLTVRVWKDEAWKKDEFFRRQVHIHASRIQMEQSDEEQRRIRQCMATVVGEEHSLARWGKIEELLSLTIDEMNQVLDEVYRYAPYHLHVLGAEVEKIEQWLHEHKLDQEGTVRKKGRSFARSLPSGEAVPIYRGNCQVDTVPITAAIWTGIRFADADYFPLLVVMNRLRTQLRIRLREQKGFLYALSCEADPLLEIGWIHMRVKAGEVEEAIDESKQVLMEMKKGKWSRSLWYESIQSIQHYIRYGMDVPQVCAEVSLHGWLSGSIPSDESARKRLEIMTIGDCTRVATRLQLAAIQVGMTKEGKGDG
ncbi:hypothetical protein [Mechercharimyces sp. CAU 1602]|uniref:hypothetical protein n=1 Tax=Mechercharimyces sp. CAU 1602 TaxID=2973933 RepID=UPI0021612343|nr:hypothetical protein [Mechercharimyces sp. CAU 1602]MCS1352501.1 hypothetical protein [Mechercharimyces sp. CAU 1602]